MRVTRDHSNQSRRDEYRESSHQYQQGFDRGAYPQRPSRVASRNSTILPSGFNIRGNPRDRPTDEMDDFNMPSFDLLYASMLEISGSDGKLLNGVGDFLGIAQQSSDNPLPNEQIMHLYNGEDMAYWLGGDSGFHGMSF